MTRFLGIDYGGKRVGLALSDDAGTMAFPHKIIENTKRLVDDIGDLVKKEEIACIVVGLPRALGDMHDTDMTATVRAFAKDLESLGLPVELEDEFLSSSEVTRQGGTKGAIDASAAAIILQSYLERRKNMLL
ncbi:MAG: Holliday junction resolvase RuvX [Patescibacteria group bacterium]